jgi:hypothetical protein
VLLAGLQAELLRTETVAYISGPLATALNAVIDERPRKREDLETKRHAVREKLQNLLAAVEAGAGTSVIFKAIHDREIELRALESELTALEEPLEQRLKIIPTWVRQQLEDTAALLSLVPERAKRQFQQLDISHSIQYARRARDRFFAPRDPDTSNSWLFHRMHLFTVPVGRRGHRTQFTSRQFSPDFLYKRTSPLLAIARTLHAPAVERLWWSCLRTIAGQDGVGRRADDRTRRRAACPLFALATSVFPLIESPVGPDLPDGLNGRGSGRGITLIPRPSTNVI